MSQPVTANSSETPPPLEVEAARQRILAQIAVLPGEPLPLLQAAGSFAVARHAASHALPPFDNSAMDGYALGLPEGAAETAAGTYFRVTGEQPAGAALGLTVAPGEAVRIFTGAPVPAGCGAVAMQEDVDRVGEQIVLREPVTPGEFVRRAGGDLARGQALFAAGDRLTPARLALLASQGVGAVTVPRPARVAVLATGDELRAPGETLGPGEIYESNGVMLAALARACGAEVTVLPRARDERGDLDAKLAQGLHGHDALVVAGGVSVGERDLVKERLRAAGVGIDLWRVHMQPGKPFVYGCRPTMTATAGAAGGGPCHVFGLPGNPVSSFVTFLLFVRPAILRLMGASNSAAGLRAVPAVAAVELTHRGDRPHYLRGILDEHGRFAPAGRQESHALFALSQSNALVRLEPGTTHAAGSPLQALLWD